MYNQFSSLGGNKFEPGNPNYRGYSKATYANI